MPTILITGATAGYGLAMARRFGRHGWNLVLVGRRTDRLETVKAELEGAIKVHVVALDVTDKAAVEQALAALPEGFAEIDVLVNNAGLALGIDPVQKAGAVDDWEVMIDTNIKGLLYVTKALLPRMVARNQGTVVNIGSVAGTYPYLGGNVYGATKAFVRQFSLNMRSDLLGTNVRVTCIEPGLSETEFSLVRFKGDADKAKTPYKGLTPLNGDDIAETVYWVSTLPPHVNINSLEIMPVQQAFAGFSFDRKL